MESKRPIVLSIVIVSFNTKDILQECLQKALKACTKLDSEIIVIDNASRDGSADMVAERFPTVKLIRNEINAGFGAANNIGFKMAQGRYLVLLNSDAFIEPDTFEKIIPRMEANQQIGLAGVRQVGRTGSWQPSARLFPSVLNDLMRISGVADKYSKSPFFGRADRSWADPP